MRHALTVAAIWALALAVLATVPVRAGAQDPCDVFACPTETAPAPNSTAPAPKGGRVFDVPMPEWFPTALGVSVLVVGVPYVAVKWVISPLLRDLDDRSLLTEWKRRRARRDRAVNRRRPP